MFRAAGLAVKTYPYFNAATNGLAFDEMLAVLNEIPEGDVVLLHGCCHNPTLARRLPSVIKRTCDEDSGLPSRRRNGATGSGGVDERSRAG